MPRLEMFLFGHPQIKIDSAPLDTDRRKAVAMLAYLAVTARPHTREQLAALFWPDYDHDSAFAYLRRTLWELNNALGKGWLAAGRETIALPRSEELWLDTAAFESLARASSDRSAALAQAASLYRDDFLAGFYVADTPPFEEWQLQQSEYFRRELGRVLERLVEAHGLEGGFETALPQAQRWLGLDPLNENAHRAVMRLYAGLGDRAGLRRQYEACTKILKEQLGVPPQRETVELYQHLIKGPQAQAALRQPAQPDDGGQPAPAAVAERPAPPQTAILHLPALPTPFIGRRPELQQVKELLLDPSHRLIALVGPGGTGKTRLSIQAASEIAGAFIDGAWFVPLAALQSPDGLVPAIAKALAFTFYKEEERPRQQLLDYLHEKELLLILDNFEHLLGEEALKLVADLLNTAKKLKLMVTSRVRLNVSGEQLYFVTGMRTPEPAAAAGWSNPEEEAQEFSGLALFLDRARRVKPTFRLEPDNLAHVAGICRLVEGLPLGIELAAAWLELLSPQEIAAEIRRSLDFLESSASDVPDRQRSIRAVFESSWKLLDEGEQQAFLYLCAFPGTFSKEAAQAVCGASLRTLLGLANKSWLGQTGKARYLLHPLLRQYGLQRLQADKAGWQTAMQRHAEFYAGFVETQALAQRTAQQITALDAVSEELESNISLAWDWLIAQGQFNVLVDRMLTGLFHFCLIRGRVEEIINLTKRARLALPRSEDRATLRQRTILETVGINFEAGWLIYEDRPKERLEELWQRVIEPTQAGEPALAVDLGFWQLILIVNYLSHIHFDQGANRLQAALPLIESDPDPWQKGYGYYLLSASYYGENQLALRELYAGKALAIFRQMGVIHEQGVVLQLLGDVAWRKLDAELFFNYKRLAMALYQQVGDFLGIGFIWFELAEIHLALGQTEQAFNAYQERRKLYEKIGNRRMIGMSLSWESLAASRYKDLDYAMQTRRRSLEISLEVGNHNDIAWHTWELGELYRLQGDYDQARFWYQEALPLFEKLQDATMLSYYQRGFGDIALCQKQWAEAERCFRQALWHLDAEQRDISLWGHAYMLSGLARALVRLGKLAEAGIRLRLALAMAREWAGPDVKFVPLLGHAELFAAQGKTEKAAELAAFIAHHPASWHETKKLAWAVLEAAGQELSAAALQEARKQGESMQIEEAIAQAIDG